MPVYYSQQNNFYGNNKPEGLVKTYGSPLYVYNETILRERCRDMVRFIPYPAIKANYSTKANSNLELLRIIRQEGLNADAMSPGEIHVLLAAGFKPEEILYIGNNVSSEEMMFAVERGIVISVDSVAQLRLYAMTNPGGKVVVRFNPGIGAGHHEKVVTAGSKTKFGVNLDFIDEVKSIIKEYGLKLIGINQHIGSLFMEGDNYIEGVKSILSIASNFEGLEFIDLGGGFGIPYKKQEGQKRLDLKGFGEKLADILGQWTKGYGADVKFKIEPGRYIVAESGVLLGTVHVIKQNSGVTYIGTDIGFNVFARPVMYDSHHDIEVYGSDSGENSRGSMKATVVGNICESGDIIAKGRMLPEVAEGDILGIMDAGAYGYCMSSNYNNRLRPAEVLIKADGNAVLIRKRESLEDLMRGFMI